MKPLALVFLLAGCAHAPGRPLLCGQMVSPPTAAATRDTVRYCREVGA